jgi:enamine deaminase RidA (YjgF/YER057c/UK114 family)
VGDVIEVSGTAPFGPDGAVVHPGDAAAQTRAVLQRIESALLELGATLADVVRTRIYVTDISRWEEIGRVHGEFFATVMPATSMVEVAALIAPGMLVEIEATAIAGSAGG